IGEALPVMLAERFFLGGRVEMLDEVQRCDVAFQLIVADRPRRVDAIVWPVVDESAIVGGPGQLPQQPLHHAREPDRERGGCRSAATLVDVVGVGHGRLSYLSLNSNDRISANRSARTITKYSQVSSSISLRGKVIQSLSSLSALSIV